MVKKSNIFMIVYVIFLFFSTYISNDEYLSKIALAATLAGMFFAFSDMLLNPAQYLSSQLDDIKKSQFELKNDLLNYTDEEKSNAVNYNTWMQKIENSEALLDKNYKSIKRMCIAGYISFAIGIFVFLAVMAFYNVDTKLFAMLLKNGNRITIIAFAVVVFNYLMQDYLFIELKKHIAPLENMNLSY